MPLMSDTETTGTRRTARGEKSGRRIESLLAIAKEVFAEKGFERTTTLEIAQRLGVSEATVFTYFGSKRELCLEVIRRWYDQISGELERELPPLNGLRAKLAFVVRKHLVNLMGEGAGLCALVLSEGRTADAAFGSVIADLKRRYTAPLMHALGAAREAGELREGVPLRLLRDMVYGAMEHVLWDYVGLRQEARYRADRRPAHRHAVERLHARRRLAGRAVAVSRRGGRCAAAARRTVSKNQAEPRIPMNPTVASSSSSSSSSLPALPERCVIVVDNALPAGLAANAAAVVALTVGQRHPGLVGAPLVDASGGVHPGLIPIGIAVLGASQDELAAVRHKAMATTECDVVDFPVQGQQTTNYAAFGEAVAAVPATDLRYVAVALIGERKPLGKVVSKLGLLG
jgi:AcrR family transcriptional regulator